MKMTSENMGLVVLLPIGAKDLTVALALIGYLCYYRKFFKPGKKSWFTAVRLRSVRMLARPHIEKAWAARKYRPRQSCVCSEFDGFEIPLQNCLFFCPDIFFKV